MLARLLEKYEVYDEAEALAARQLKMFLAESANAYDRTNLIAHVVADAWIVNPDRSKVVLIEHLENKSWMAAGGHCDGNPDVMAAAIREAEEETGLTNLKPLLGGNIFDLNVGHVPQRQKPWGIEPVHLHFDIGFAFEAPDNADLKISDESTGLKWVPIAEIKDINFFQDHMPRVHKTLAGKI